MQAAANRSAVGSAAAGTAGAGAIAGGAQAQYDVAYAQCMTSKGDVIENPTAAVAAPSYDDDAYPYYGAYPYGGVIGIGPFFWGRTGAGDGMGAVGTAGGSTGPRSMAASAAAAMAAASVLILNFVRPG